MAAMNPFDLLGDNDNDDPSQLIESASVQLQKVALKKTPTPTSQAQFQKPAKLHTKPVPPAQAAMATTAEVIKKFFIASMFMWMFPLAILYGFQHDWFLGVANLSPYSQTLLGGFLAVISVNVVIAFYICMAMKEPTDKHEPDPSFVAKAKASLNQSKPDEKEE